MNNPGKNIKYTALDFQRYHSGKMNEQEMYALEKAALDDPFLADALEGYVYTNSPEQDINELQEKLAMKEGKKKRGLFLYYKNTWLKIAAILILVAGIFYLVFDRNEETKSPLLAKKESIVNKNNEGRHTDSSFIALQKNTGKENNDLKIITDTTIQSIPEGSVKIKQEKDYTITATDAQASTFSFEDSDKKEKKDISSVQNNPGESLPLSTRKKVARRDAAVDEAVLKDRTALDYETISSDSLRSQNNFTGKVMNDKGEPVAFASIKGNKGETFTTDVNGNFSVTAKDSILPVTIAAVGYNNLQKDILNNIDQTIVLSRNNQELSTVVVTAMGSMRQKASLGYSTAKPKDTSWTMDPFSSDHKLAFDKYISTHIQRPKKETGEVFTGEVILSFKIKMDGTPYKIRVEKKLCEECNKEAIRLLTQGPKWNYKNEKRTTISINF